MGNNGVGIGYRIQTGEAGRNWETKVAVQPSGSGKGGKAGEGYGGNNGGGGGAATTMRAVAGNVIIAGAAGGGGGGGFGEGVCGQNGRENPNPGNAVQETTATLFSGNGATGGHMVVLVVEEEVEAVVSPNQVSLLVDKLVLVAVDQVVTNKDMVVIVEYPL